MKEKKRPGAPKENQNAVGNAGGRPSSYRDEYADQAYKLCLLGFTDKQLAVFFEVCESTLAEWKNKVVEFSEALRRGKTVADGEVAASLFKRAIGFKYNEVTFEKVDTKGILEALGEDKITVDAYKKKVVTKLVIPDTGAQTLWLKNRQKEYWRDKQDLGINFDEMPEELLDTIINRLTEKATKG